MGREGRGGKGGEDRGGEGKGLEGRAREGTPNILLHPQFQFSRIMPGAQCYVTLTFDKQSNARRVELESQL